MINFKPKIPAMLGALAVLALSAFAKGVFCTDTPFFHVFSGY